MKGFTIIELLVVLAITALMSAFAISYSGTSRDYTALAVQESELAQVILQAKELSIATYASPVVACGYGVKINANSTPQTFSIFAYSPVGVLSCPTETALATRGISSAEEQSSTSATWKVPVARGVQIQSDSDSMILVLFYPPNPDVFLSQDGKTFESTSQSPGKTLKVHLATIDEQNTATLSISSEGQVSL